MINNYYACGLNLNKRPVLLVGADREATEKYKKLKKAGARVRWIKKKFTKTHLKGKFLVILTLSVSIKDVKWAYAYCRKNRILCCALDRPPFLDIVNVSVYDRGLLRIAISTNGAAPSVSRKIRLGLEKSLKNVPIEKFMTYLAGLRPKYLKKYPNAKDRIPKLIAATDGFRFEAKLKLPRRKK